MLGDQSAGEIGDGDGVVNNLEPKGSDVALVFQNYGVHLNLTMHENIRFPLRIREVGHASHDTCVRSVAAEIEKLVEATRD